jgi:hypothetical protein
MIILKTALEVIDALGGISKTAKLFGISLPAVSHWKTRGLSRDRRDAIERALSAKGFTCSPALWRQKGMVE